MRFTLKPILSLFFVSLLLAGCKDNLQPAPGVDQSDPPVVKKISFDLEQKIESEFIPLHGFDRTDRLSKREVTPDPYNVEQNVEVSVYGGGNYVMDIRTLWNAETTIPRDIPDVRNIGLTRVTPTETILYDESGNIIERMNTQGLTLEEESGGVGALSKTQKPFMMPFAAPTKEHIPSSAYKREVGKLTAYSYQQTDTETGDLLNIQTFFDNEKNEIIRETAEIKGKLFTDVSYTYRIHDGEKVIASQKSITKLAQKEGTSVISGEARYKNLRISK